MPKPRGENKSLEKTPTGISEFDEMTFGGLPKGRPTLIAGTAGCGKTLFALEFLIRGATEYREPGVFLAFEETAEELTKNVASIGFAGHGGSDSQYEQGPAIGRAVIEQPFASGGQWRVHGRRSPGRCG